MAIITRKSSAVIARFQIINPIIIFSEKISNPSSDLEAKITGKRCGFYLLSNKSVENVLKVIWSKPFPVF